MVLPHKNKRVKSSAGGKLDVNVIPEWVVVLARRVQKETKDGMRHVIDFHSLERFFHGFILDQIRHENGISERMEVALG